MYTMNESEITKRHFKDLSDQSYRNNMFTFTDFLSEADVADLYAVSKELSPCGFSVYGGFDGASRVIVRFGNPDELGYSADYPISLLKIEPLSKKFADDLSHRDFLGAIMNLGIERDIIGDILTGEKEAYVFCLSDMADMLMRELTRVRHTSVNTIMIDELPSAFAPTLKDLSIQVASLRIDGIIAKYTKLSRSQTADLFHERKVFVNGRLMENYSYQIKSSDVVSVRGFGKFIFSGQTGQTKKGNLLVTIQVYS